jgi:DNA-directed RNA polymerase subunit RPC12/RpoP
MFSWLRALFRDKATGPVVADSNDEVRIVVTPPCPDCGGRRFLVRQSDPIYSRMTCATCGSSFEVPRSLVAGMGA